MLLNEEFEVKFKDKDSPQQRKMLLDALVDLYNNIHKYHIVKRIDSNDQTSRFMDRFYITQGDIATLLEDYAFTLKVTEWGDILDDRDRANNLLYILYIPNAKVGNWDYTKSREKLLYIKWNPKNRNIISFHTMSAVQQTNRDKLTENKTMNIQDVIDFVYTHTDEDFVLTDLEVLKDLKKDLKDGTKPMYELDDVKGIKDDIIQTIELNSEQKKVLNNFVKKVEGLYKEEGKIEEKLSLQQIRSRDVYSKNAHVNKFYNIRKDLVGTPNRNIKFITSQLNDDGSADFLFQTVVTPYEDVDHVYKELIDAPIADIVNASAMKTNNSGEYMMCLRINDFWDLIEELEVVEKNEFDKNTLSAILDLSEDVKYSCNCVSYVWSGISYFATQEDASLIPNNIYPKKWDKYRAGALCCKHLSGLFRTLSFQIPKMSQSIKKNMRDQGLID
jgi:hypothetical protein